MTLVEKMARAICAAQGLDWKDQFSIYSSNGDPLAHEAYMHDADAALSALRQWLADEWLVVVPGEATIAMTHAVWTTDLPRPDMHGDYSDLDVQMAARDIWRSMIAAAPDALREGE